MILTYLFIGVLEAEIIKMKDVGREDNDHDTWKHNHHMPWWTVGGIEIEHHKTWLEQGYQPARRKEVTLKHIIKYTDGWVEGLA